MPRLEFCTWTQNSAHDSAQSGNRRHRLGVGQALLEQSDDPASGRCINLRKYSIMGNELFGVVEAVGSSVTRFAKGDRVLACVDKDIMGPFAAYAVVHDARVAVFPMSGGGAARRAHRAADEPTWCATAHHHLAGHLLLLLMPRATSLCHVKANSASNIAPMPTGATKKSQDISLTTTTNGSMPAGG